MKNFGSILWGLVFIVIGSIIGLNALGITDIDIFFEGWWTLFIIIPCFVGLFTDENKTGGFIGLLIGFVLLLGCQDVLSFDLIGKLLVPVILIIIGLSFIFKDVIHNDVKKEIKKLNDKSKNNQYNATFSAQDIKIDEEFKGCDLSAVFGGIGCDLRESEIKKDVVINTSAIFGGIDIYVPNGVKVKVKSNSIFGGVSNKKNSSKKEGPVIYINATCIFGGVEIK